MTFSALHYFMRLPTKRRGTNIGVLLLDPIRFAFDMKSRQFVTCCPHWRERVACKSFCDVWVASCFRPACVLSFWWRFAFGKLVLSCVFVLMLRPLSPAVPMGMSVWHARATVMCGLQVALGRLRVLNFWWVWFAFGLSVPQENRCLF